MEINIEQKRSWKKARTDLSKAIREGYNKEKQEKYLMEREKEVEYNAIALLVCILSAVAMLVASLLFSHFGH